MDQAVSPTPTDTAHTWRPLRLLNFYRVILSGAFLIVAALDLSIKPLGTYSPELFTITAGGYFLAACISALTISLRRPGFGIQVFTQVMLDVLALTLIMHSSGSVQSGIGMLLIVTIAGGSLLLAGQASLHLAATATLAVLIEHTYYQISTPEPADAYTRAGLLGIAFFATAILAHTLAKRIRESEALARQRGADLADLQQLTKYIVQRMQTGVALVDEQHKLWMLNESGSKLLGIPSPERAVPLDQASPQLGAQYHSWLKNSYSRGHRFRPLGGSAEVLPRFAKLSGKSETVIFLEDSTALAMQAQQLKLASMGRLAGSIAHEIRNPLGAISHAEQLLSESPNLDNADRRLTEIIRNNSKRMNAIIENTMQLGRRRESAPETIKLKPWLARFKDEFCHGQNVDMELVTLTVEPDELEIQFDADQLHQIIWNLCHNGARHSRDHSGKPTLHIKAHMSDNNAHLDIIDNGPGISEEDAEQIFEPFFTTESSGTGLGLYIARELSECNHAHLNCLKAETGGCCFRLTFVNPEQEEPL